jgi:hypothetical protein
MQLAFTGRTAIDRASGTPASGLALTSSSGLAAVTGSGGTAPPQIVQNATLSLLSNVRRAPGADQMTINQHAPPVQAANRP